MPACACKQAQRYLAQQSAHSGMLLCCCSSTHVSRTCKQHACCGCASANRQLQASKPPAAADEHLQELTTLRERVQQMTNRMGQMEQKVKSSQATETHALTHMLS
jgi:hypothetical protein